MRRFAIVIVVIGALALAACGSSSGGGGGGGSSTIQMGSGVFTTNTATVKAGQAVTFDDTNGGPHNLVVGSNGKASSQSGAPSELSGSGLSFNGGDTKTVTFSTAGTYMITCTIHPSMEATITVTQ
jgi:plastocyanin